MHLVDGHTLGGSMIVRFELVKSDEGGRHKPQGVVAGSLVAIGADLVDPDPRVVRIVQLLVGDRMHHLGPIALAASGRWPDATVFELPERVPFDRGQSVEVLVDIRGGAPDAPAVPLYVLVA